MFYFTKKGMKHWYCVEHYDRMAAHYQKRAREERDAWCIEMVGVNGW